MKAWRLACAELGAIFQEQALFNAAEKMALSLGFDAFMFGLSLPTSVQRPTLKLYGSCAIPPGWEDEFKTGGVTQLDMAVSRAHAMGCGSSWAEPGFRGEHEFWINTLACDMPYGWSQPTRGLGLAQGIASFARKSGAITESEQDQIELKIIVLAQVLHAQMMAILTGKNALYDPLTPRELNILRWAADGKTAHETSAILQIPVRTVLHSRSRCQFKMRAINIVQAAALAQAFGLLQGVNPRPRPMALQASNEP